MSLRTKLAALVAACVVGSFSAGAVAAPTPESAVPTTVDTRNTPGAEAALRDAAGIVEPFAYGEGASRDIRGAAYEGGRLAVVLDATYVPGVGGKARVTVVDVERKVVVHQTNGAAPSVTSTKNDPVPRTPVIRGRGTDAMLCQPAYSYLAYDEACLARKDAAELAAHALCVVGAGVGAITGPLGAVAMAIACAVAQEAVNDIKCDPILVNVPEFCTRMYPEPVKPEVQKAREEYKKQTGQDPPDPCDSRKAARVQDESSDSRPPVCE